MGYKVLVPETKELPGYKVESQATRGLFGLSPEAEAQTFPKVVEKYGTSSVPVNWIEQIKDIARYPGKLAAASEDLLSLLGRGLASVGPGIAPGGETYSEAIKRTKPKPEAKGVGRWADLVLRDSYLIPSMLAGGGSTAARGISAVRQIPGRMAYGAATQAPVAITRQTLGAIQGDEDTTPVDRIKDAMLETLGGALGEAGGGVWEAGARKVTAPIGKWALKGSAKIKDVTAKRAGKTALKGVQKIVDDIDAYNLSSKRGWGGMLQKANKAISDKVSKADDLIQAYASKNPGSTFDVDEVFLNLMEDVGKGKYIGTFGDDEAAQKILGNIYKSLEVRNLGGRQPVTNIPKIRNTISEGLDLFRKGKFNINEDPLKRYVGEISYLDLNKTLHGKIPELKPLGQQMHDLINVEAALTEAAKRTGNWNSIANLSQLATTFPGLAAIAGGHGKVGLPMMILGGALKAGAEGRGASTILQSPQLVKTFQRAAQPVMAANIRADIRDQLKREAMKRRLQGEQ